MGTDPKPRSDALGTRRRLRQRLPALLEPDEAIRFVWPASRGDPARYLPLSVGIGMLALGIWNIGSHLAAVMVFLVLIAFVGWRAQKSAGPVAIVATDRALVLVQTRGWLDGSQPVRVIARLPRDTKVGPLSGRTTRVNLGGVDVWVPIACGAEVAVWDVDADEAAPD